MESNYKSRKIKSVPLKKFNMWMIKHRNANFSVRAGWYETKVEAQNAFATIPTNGLLQGGQKYCQGCGVGCADEYEIIKVQILQVKEHTGHNIGAGYPYN